MPDKLIVSPINHNIPTTISALCITNRSIFAHIHLLTLEQFANARVCITLCKRTVHFACTRIQMNSVMHLHVHKLQRDVYKLNSGSIHYLLEAEEKYFGQLVEDEGLDARRHPRAPDAPVMEVQRDDGQGRGERHQADAHPVIEACNERDRVVKSGITHSRGHGSWVNLYRLEFIGPPRGFFPPAFFLSVFTLGCRWVYNQIGVQT